LDQAEKAIERLRSALKPALPGAVGAPEASLQSLVKQITLCKAGFIESMDDDFNSSGALAQLFDLVRVTNQLRADGATDAQLKTGQDVIVELTNVLGLTLQQEKEESHAADAFVNLLIEIRKNLREDKQWALSDKVRDRLVEQGVVLEDSKEGTLWHWK